MTTHIKIFNEGPRPVQVCAIEKVDAETEVEPAATLQVIKPGETIGLYMWRERDLRIKEL